MTERGDGHGRDVVALALAVGLGFAVACLTIAVLWDAIASEGPGLSDNATQVLLTTFSGIVGVLGGYLGYQAGNDARRRRDGETSPAAAPPDAAAGETTATGERAVVPRPPGQPDGTR